jgi:hypothetical protein
LHPVLPQVGGGINGLAQIVKDIGAQSDARKLAKAAEVYDNAAVRRLGYLLDQAGYKPKAGALEPFVKAAKTSIPLNPSVKPLIASLVEEAPRVAKWKLIINEPVEIDF